MASTETAAAPTFHHFVVWAPDKTDEGTFEKRLSVRSHHLEGLSKLIGNGDVRQCVFLKEVGGVLLTPQSIETATSDKKMTGSMLIFQAENIEKIRVIIESDVYYTSGVWDPEKLVICPFMPALPLP